MAKNKGITYEFHYAGGSFDACVRMVMEQGYTRKQAREIVKSRKLALDRACMEYKPMGLTDGD